MWLALWLAVVGNLALWRDLSRLASGPGAPIVIGGAFVVVLAALCALMLLTAWGRWMKPLWIAILVAAGIAQHFMLTYGVVMDTAMLANTLQTDPREVRDLLGWTFAANMALVIALPALLVILVPVRRTPWWPQLWKNAALFAAALAVTLVASFAMFSRLAPLVRNNMHLRYIVNPIAGFTSAATVTLGPLFRKSKQLVPITAGVALGPSYASQQKPPLLVLVVGETARADHFSLNGYPRETNPELAKAGVFSFRDVRSCGTDTRDSVPCMLSPLGKAAFEKRGAEHENLLDLLQAAGLAVLWLDNQSGCKDVCSRVPTADDRRPARRRRGPPVQCRRVPRRGSSRRPRRAHRPPARGAAQEGHGPRPAPDGQPRPGLLQALAAGSEALPARVHEHDARPMRPRAARSTPTTTRSSRPTASSPTRSPG